MKVASVRDLRNEFAKIARWLEEGEAVEIRRRGKAIGRIAPARRSPAAGLSWPDFEARARKTFGGHVTPDSQSVIDEARGPR
ncbi:MAG: type II toxin-antitoxin system Phd/YefM family antitoxin [Polyangiaceae bacterium]